MGLEKLRSEFTPSPRPSAEGKTEQRLWSLDISRGLAVMAMLVFHFSYDVKTFSPYGVVNLSWLPFSYWYYAPRVIGASFLFLLGFSCWLKYDGSSTAQNSSFPSFLRSGFKLLAIALLVSLGTAFFMPAFTIYFGILHCMAVIRIGIYPLLKFKFLNLGIALVLIGAGPIISKVLINTRLLMPLGIRPHTDTGGDWYPLIPWAAAALIGVFTASLLKNRLSVLHFAPSSSTTRKLFKPLEWMGRHSLLIYLIHQPLFISALKIFFGA